MFKIVRADRAGLALDMWRKRDWVIVCLNAFMPQEGLWIDPQDTSNTMAMVQDRYGWVWLSHGSMSQGVTTKRIAKSMLAVGEVDWCAGCQWEKEQNEREGN